MDIIREFLTCPEHGLPALLKFWPFIAAAVVYYWKAIRTYLGL